jgi:hypothetical protein
MESVAVLLTLLYLAVMIAEMVELTDVVVMVKVAVVLPAATVTLAGTVAEALLLASEIETPPLGAALLRATVPVDDVPPVTLVGLIASEASVAAAAGVMESEAALLTLL